MSEVTATDANRYFSKLLQRAENGEHITITKDGKPVAVLMPSGPSEAKRAAARERMLELMRKGLDFEYEGPLDRDELYQRK
jgi:prevent-host-death family protein